MNEVEAKFNNMKKLCHDIDPDNDWVKQLQEVHLSVFIATIKTKNHLTKNEIYETLIDKSQIDKTKLINHDAKIKRYIDYFHQISKII